MYANAPPEVAAMKTMLEASSTWVALSGTIHYPSVSAGDSAAAVTPPYALIEPIKNTPKVLAPGVVVLGGTLQIILVMVNSTAGALDIEKTARAICDDLTTQAVGLPITGTEVGMCSEPDAATRAEQEFSDENSLARSTAVRSIPIIITYGLS